MIVSCKNYDEVDDQVDLTEPKWYNSTNKHHLYIWRIIPI